MISALNPLTRGCRTDFLLQSLRQLNCRLYTDALFAKDKSIVGNTCTHIFVDTEFVKIIPIRSKSEDVLSLYRINWDSRFLNEIFMDNST